ncbi:MAG: Gfo/Idh/MocA family oxidoreductase [Flavobacteriales bacterium]|nr:Gfo/Idh/MocA family oxidoreductase [Flavobacteriales bacterium]
MKKVRFVTVGTSFITDWFLQGAMCDHRFECAGIFSRNEATGREFATKHGVGKVYTSLDDVAQDTSVDAVYVASPNALHYEHTVFFLSHGKHVLCEKAFASNATQVRKMTLLAQEKGLSLMEAMKTTHSATFASVKEHLPQIGQVRRYFASYCQYSSRYDRFKQGIILNAFRPELSNGSLMDIGVYGLYPMVALFGKPKSVTVSAQLLHTGVDGQGTLVCHYDDMDGVVLHSKIADSSLPSEIQGEKGRIIIDRINTIDTARIEYKDGRVEDISRPHPQHDMVSEVSAFITMIENGAVENKINTFENSIIVMEIMDAARNECGVKYPSDSYK